MKKTIIAIVPIFIKLFEKMMYCRLYNYQEQNKIIHPLPFGFRKNYSTSHALISIAELIRNSLDNYNNNIIIIIINI